MVFGGVGVMTGKRRFGEFGGEWREVRLEEIAKLITGEPQIHILKNIGEAKSLG